MATKSEERLARLIEQLEQRLGVAEEIPGDEGQMVREAMDGKDVYQIAMAHSVTEARVWQTLQDAAREATGQPMSEVETGGFGSDTDPGVTGGYGETGFGSLGNEPPIANPEEPRQM